MTHVNRLRSALGAMAQVAAAGPAAPRIGLVSSYDPQNYAVKVKLQPTPEDGNDLETGWLPVWTPWVGNQWGLFCPPQVGDQVLILFQEGSVQNGICLGGIYSDIDQPLPCPSKEFWLVHESGSSLKFTNDGTVTVVTQKDLVATVGNKLTANIQGDADLTVGGDINSSAAAWNHKGDVHVTGGDVTADGISLKNHTHSDPQGGTVGPPTG